MEERSTASAGSPSFLAAGISEAERIMRDHGYEV